MNTSDVMDLINDLEGRFAVDQWKAGDIHIWPFLRIKLNFDLYYAHHACGGNSGVTTLARVVGLLKSLARFSYAVLADAGKNCRPREHADVLLVSDGLSFAYNDGEWYEKFCDPFIDRFSSQNISTFLLLLSHAYHIPRRSSSLFMQPRLDATRIRCRIFPSATPANEALQKDYPAYRAYLEGLCLQLTVPTLDSVQRYAAELRRLSAVWAGLLRRTTPSLVLVVSYYGMEGLALNLACRELGIPSVDLQHGLQGNLHVAYARWKRVPSYGYEMLPTFFWVWEQSDAKTIEQWNAQVSRWHRPLVGGNLWLNEWLSGENNLVAKHDRKLQDVRALFPGKYHVLITLQLHQADDRTLDSLFAAMRKTGQEYHWWIRLHPCMLGERGSVRAMLERNEISDFELDLATDLPLYALLRQMDLHLTHSSSTVIEAAFFGIPSVLISSYGAEFFPDQTVSGWAVTALTEDTIIEAIRVQLASRADLKHKRPVPVKADSVIDELIHMGSGRSLVNEGSPKGS